MTLRVLVVDDVAPARRRLTRMLDAVPEVEVVGEAESGMEAVERIESLSPDLVLLDIQMPALDGFGVIAAVGPDAMPDVVFVTAYDEHAVRAFEVNALDYLLKPVAPERLRAAIDRAAERRSVAVDASPPDDVRAAASPGGLRAAASPDDARAAALEAVVRSRPLRRLLVRDDRGARLLGVDAIELARAERNYVALHTADGVYRVRGTIGTLADRLDPEAFLRVNRSDIVRVDAIADMQPWSHGDYRIVLRGGLALLWSRRYRAASEAEFEL